MKYQNLACMLLILLVLACAKISEKIDSPRAIASIEIKENSEIYSLKLKGLIENENSNVALVDFKGVIQFIDPENHSKVLSSMPFNIPMILPYETAFIDVEKRGSERDLIPLIELVGIDKEELENERTAAVFRIDSKLFRLENLSYGKTNITEILRKKINEKNK
ncbi:hypothetical protein ACFL20_03340 [Spirochaetota bacterium]